MPKEITIKQARMILSVGKWKVIDSWQMSGFDWVDVERAYLETTNFPGYEEDRIRLVSGDKFILFELRLRKR